MKLEEEGTVTEDHATNDVLTPEQRRFVMTRIRNKNTKPELIIRRGLHARGLRYRLHKAGIPGKPDLVFANYRTVIFVHGCFWHGHECSLFRWPKTREKFWKNKIRCNMERDKSTLTALRAMGWRVLVIWGCALRGRNKRALVDLLDNAENFVRYDDKSYLEIREKQPDRSM